jgi:hypothetical protein
MSMMKRIIPLLLVLMCMAGAAAAQIVSSPRNAGGGGTVTNLVQQPNGPSITNGTTTPVITSPTNTWYAQNYSGATADVKIAACLAAVPAGGGTCDATGLIGAQTLAAEIDIPSYAVLLLGPATFTASASPVFTMGVDSRLSGFTHSTHTGITIINVPSGGTGVRGAGTLGSINNGWTVENIAFEGTSETDGSIGIDLIATLEAIVTSNQLIHLQTGIRIGGNGNCSCYNLLADNWGGGSGTGLGVFEDYQVTANQNTSYSDVVHGTVSQGIFLENGAGSNHIMGFDAEVLGAGTAIEIAGAGNLIDGNLYIEGGSGTAILFDSTAVQNTISSGGTVSITTPLNYGTSAVGSNYVNLPWGKGIGGNPIYPVYIGAANYLLPSGSNPQYFQFTTDTAFASGTIGVADLYMPGGTAETIYGYTGHASHRVGWLEATGGTSLKGSTVTSTISTPATPSCAVTCEPSDTTNCSSPATTYTYAVVGIDFNGQKTTRSTSTTCVGSASLITAAAQNAACTAPATPIACCTSSGHGTCVGEGQTIAWTKQDGIKNWDIVGNLDLVHSLQTAVSVPMPGSVASPGTTYSYADFGTHTPASYTVPTRNTTADISNAGNLTLGAPTAGCTSTTQGCLNMAVPPQVNGVAYLAPAGKGMPFASTTVSVTAPTAVGCTDGTVAVASSTTTMSVLVTPQSNPNGSSGAVSWQGYISAAGTADVRVCNLTAETSPPATTYNVIVLN